MFWPSAIRRCLRHDKVRCLQHRLSRSWACVRRSYGLLSRLATVPVVINSQLSRVPGPFTDGGGYHIHGWVQSVLSTSCSCCAAGVEGMPFLGSTAPRVRVISLVPRAVYWIIPTVEIDSRSCYTVAVSADSKDNVSCHFAMVGGSATQHRVLGGWARRATYHTEGWVVVDIRVSLRRVLSSRVVLLVLVQRGAWGWCSDKKGT